MADEDTQYSWARTEPAQQKVVLDVTDQDVDQWTEEAVLSFRKSKTRTKDTVEFVVSKMKSKFES